ncbi:hypothetical protein SCH01S_44_00110 [Sphingomonas changbaiensis NBRC 104936]|uniref:Uncharacterized protein n=1 Tax=Sphingomonas changbaiensis NBRC 104936 TaxID=1219043 RepID=A0A0E9MSN9_9SPHN|nr:hypothetical protein [Sphingomonas changbaiensis]GAO40150.1 hypothetical protein SCH01S_44_00110 [Sphingomonas changbaiensis NBRC 104936]
MRGLLAVIAIIVLLLIIGVATGFLNINQTKTAELPKVEVKGGQAPAFDANVGAVDVGTKKETIKVPTVDVKTANETSNK